MRHFNLVPTALGSLAFAALALGCAESAPEVAQDAVAADPGHYSVEFENDAVRLLRITYGPGETSVMHHHPATCSIALADASWRMTDPEGNVTDDTAAFGEVECGDASDHLPENTSEGRAELILVEFKEGARAGSGVTSEHPAADQADPTHYTVVHENDAARLIHIRYSAGETSVMHHHPANCAIFVRGQPTTMELPSGEVEEMPMAETGQVTCWDAGAHKPTNMGSGPTEVVLVEMKGRATLQ